MRLTLKAREGSGAEKEEAVAGDMLPTRGFPARASLGLMASCEGVRRYCPLGPAPQAKTGKGGTGATEARRVVGTRPPPSSLGYAFHLKDPDRQTGKHSSDGVWSGSEANQGRIGEIMGAISYELALYMMRSGGSLQWAVLKCRPEGSELSALCRSWGG